MPSTSPPPLLTVDSLPAFERLWMPIWVFDSERARMVWGNAAALELWEAATLEEFLGRDFSDMSEATRTRLDSLLRRLAAGEQPVDQWTFYPRGKPVTVRVRRTGIRVADGRLAMLHEAHAVELPTDPAALRGIEAVHHTNVMISLHAMDGRPVMRNPAAVRAYGEVGDGIGTGATLCALFEDPAQAQLLLDTLRGGGTFSAEARMHTAGGPRWHGLDARVVTDPVSGDAAVLVNEQDIDARKEATDALRHASTDLARSNAELEAFAYVVSHDLRQPLRSVASFLTLLEKHLEGTLDDDAREFLDFARGGAQRMDRLIVDLLEYSRIGRKTRPKGPVPLGEALEEAMLDLEAAAAESGAAVAADGPLPTVYGDRAELVRLLQNLIGNALKYRAPDRPPMVRLSAAPSRGGWRVSVADNGIGIAPEHHERVFGIFQRLHGRDEYEGTGIGLAVCRKIAEHHGGRIWVESVEGAGSVFHVALPSAPPPSPNEVSPTCPAPTP